MHADRATFHRFDRFNLKYNPFGQARLREVFIKQDNLLRGRYLAELTAEVFADLEASKYQHAEYRVSIYGRKRVEWDTLAAWVAQNRLASDNVVWLIQLPRLYDVYKAQGIIDNFGQLLDNVFGPLFEVTLNPASHPQLHLFLRHVVGFDMVDDESKPERRPAKHMPPAAAWDIPHNPAYAYYAYYVAANLYTLNKLREARGLAPFDFRPHAGEAGDVDHLASAFLLAQNISHGIGLRKCMPLQYLYYLAQVGEKREGVVVVGWVECCWFCFLPSSQTHTHTPPSNRSASACPPCPTTRSSWTTTATRSPPFLRAGCPSPSRLTTLSKST